MWRRAQIVLLIAAMHPGGMTCLSLGKEGMYMPGRMHGMRVIEIGLWVAGPSAGGHPRTRAPRTGEHAAEVLAELRAEVP